MSLRIGLTTTRIEPFNAAHGLDGIGTYTGHLLQNLPPYGCAVQPYCFVPARHQNSPALIGHPFAHPYGVQVLMSEFANSTLRLKQSIDLLHVTDYHIARADVPIVASLHDAIPLLYPEWTTPRFRATKNWLMKRSARHANWVIALSESAVDDIVAGFGVNRERISVIPCGVDERWLRRPDANDIARVLAGRSLEPGYFLFVGTLQPRKNVARIVQAYRTVPESIRRQRALVIVGRPGWRCETDIAAVRDARADGEHVVWLNDVRDSGELLCLYAAAGQFVFPSLYEGFGIPVLEAFACRVPVLTSNVSSLPEVAAGAALQVNPTSVKSIADGMVALIEDEALAKSFVELGDARVREYTWSRTAQLTAEVYRAVAN